MILAQRPTRISAVATILLITKTFTVKYYDRRERAFRPTNERANKQNKAKTLLVQSPPPPPPPTAGNGKTSTTHVY